MVFSPNIIVHTVPAVSINADDGTAPNAVTYNEIKNSMGSIVYDVNQLYIYSTNASQLTGVINYKIFDASGNESVNPIVTTINPNQFANAIYVDLKERGSNFLLNGNSNFNAKVLPNTSILVKFYVEQVTRMDNENFSGLEQFFGVEDGNNGMPTKEDKYLTVVYSNFEGKKDNKMGTLFGIACLVAAGYITYKIFKDK